MKLKKRIMLVVSMAIMTLSTVLSSMQVYAASNYKEVKFDKAVSSANYTDGAPLKFSLEGQSVYVDIEDTVYTYPSVDNGVVYYTMRFGLPLSQYGSIPKLDDKTTALLWDLQGSLWLQYKLSATGDSTSTQYIDFTMWVDECNLIVYNKAYPVAITVDNPSTDAGTHISTVDSWVYVDEVPVVRQLSSYYVEMEVRLGIKWSYNTYLDQEITFTPRACFDMNYLRYYECFGEELIELKAIVDALNDISALTDEQKALMQTYYPKLNQMLLLLQNDIKPDLQDLLYYTEGILDEFERANISLDVNNSELVILNARMVNIHEELISLHNTLIEQGTSDKNTTDGFKQDSDSQSNQLNNLNQQSQPDKIDVDNASGVVDQNLNINTDANYGVLLSTFTSNGKILTMLLAVSSIGLISYVLFGKR